MTTSTFSFVISPPLFRSDVRHVGNAERLVAFHGAVDDIDRIGTQHRIGERGGAALPVLDLVLPHAVDELALILARGLRELFAEYFFARLVDRQKRAAIKIGEWRAEVEDAGLKQRFLRRHRYLLIDVVRDPGFACLRHQRLAQRLQSFALMGIEQAERHVTRPRLVRLHQDFDAAHRKGQRTQRRALHKTTPTNAFHGLLLPELCLHYLLLSRSDGWPVLLASSDNESRIKQWPMMHPRQPAQANSSYATSGSFSRARWKSRSSMATRSLPRMARSPASVASRISTSRAQPRPLTPTAPRSRPA